MRNIDETGYRVSSVFFVRKIIKMCKNILKKSKKCVKDRLKSCEKCVS